MSTSKKSRVILHNSSEHYSEWINSDTFSCACIQHGKHKELLEGFGAWHSISAVQPCVTPHFTSSMFLNEYASNLRYKRAGKHQSGQQFRFMGKDDTIYQFKHELSEEHHITAYRSSKGASDDKIDGFDEKQQGTVAANDECPVCAAREILKDAISNRNTSSAKINNLTLPLIDNQRTSGVYLEPFYPALYGQVQGPIRNGDPYISTITANGIHLPLPGDQVSRDYEWMPDNAVCQYRQPTRHSICYRDNGAVIFLDSPDKKSTGTLDRGLTKKENNTNKATGDSNKEKPVITNFRTLSGRPIALVAMNKDKKSKLHSTVTDKLFLRHSAKPNESKSHSKPASSEGPEKEQATGKLLQGRLHTPFNFQTAMDQLVVESTTFKQLQTQSSESFQCEVKLMKAKLRPLKQNSIISIPHRHSLKAQLPDLDVRPASSLMIPGMQQKLKHEEDTSEKTYILNQKDTDILLTTPAVVNHSLESKVHAPAKDSGAEASPLSVLHTLSSRLKPTPQTSSYLKSWISSNSCSRSNPFLVTTANKPLQEKSFMYTSSDSFDEVPYIYRHKLVNLKKLDNEQVEGAPEAGVEARADDQSKCVYRSQQRRQRRQQKLLSGQSGKKRNTLVDELGPVSVKKPSPKIKVFVRGKAKTLLDFLPSHEMLQAE